MELLDLTALQLGQKIKNGEIGVREAAAASLNRIRAAEPAIHSFVSFDEEAALARADEIQKKISAGELLSPLAGVPMAVKDNICTKGVATTCSSKMLDGFVPTYSANAWNLLENAGAVMLGKTNLDEFAMGSTTETSYFGTTHNPWDLSRVPGGSSGGSAAAVAAGEAYYTLGSDTGGSIRQPAAFCGVTGIKPTYGSVSRYGLVAFASSLDQIGPSARDAADCAAVLNEIMKHDRRDSTSVSTAAPGLSVVQNGNVKGMKIGIPKNFYGEGLDGEVRDTILKAAEQFRAMGAELEEFDMPIVKYAVPTYYILATAEASSNLARYDGIKYGYRAKDYADLAELYTKTRSEGFGMEVKRRILLGCFVLSSGYYDAYYLKALKVRNLIKQAFDRAFEKYDIILSPTAPTTAYKIGENDGDPLKLYLGDIYTAMINIIGLPAVTAPCGFDSNGLPVGLQLIGKPFGEETLLTAACAYQKETDYHNRRPSAFLKGGEAQ